MNIYPSNLYTTLESSSIKGSISFTSDGTINANGVSASIITDGVSTLVDGYLHGVVNTVLNSSLVNKEYIDNLFNEAYGSSNEIQFNNTNTLASSPSLTFNSNQLNAPKIQANTISIDGLSLGSTNISSNDLMSSNIVLPNDNGFNTAILKYTTNTNPSASGSLEWTSNVYQPGGSLYTLQYNDNGTFNGLSSLIYNSNTLISNGCIYTNSVATITGIDTYNLNLSNSSTQNILQLVASSSLLTNYTLSLPNSLPTKTAYFTANGSSSLYFNTPTGAIAEEPLNSIQCSDGSTLIGSSELLYNNNSISIKNDIFTLSNILPTTVSSVIVPTTINRISFKENYSYVCGIDTLMIINNYNSPIIVSTHSFPNIINAIPYNNLLFTITNNQFGISSTSVEIPFVTLGISGINNFSINTNYAYVSATTSYVVDFSNVISPQTVYTFGNSNASIFSYELYSVNNNGLYVYDVYNSFTTIGFLSLSNLTNIGVNNGRGCIYCSNTSTFYVVDVSNVSSMSVVTSYNYGNINSFIVSGSDLFISNNTSIIRAQLNNLFSYTTLGIPNKAIGIYDGYLYTGVFKTTGVNYSKYNIYGSILGSSNIDSINAASLIVEDSLVSDSQIIANTINTDLLSVSNKLTGIVRDVQIINYGSCVCNSYFGRITLSNPSVILVGTSNQISVNNIYCMSGSIIKININKFSSGFPVISISNKMNGSFVINIYNGHLTNATSGLLSISFMIM